MVINTQVELHYVKILTTKANGKFMKLKVLANYFKIK